MAQNRPFRVAVIDPDEETLTTLEKILNDRNDYAVELYNHSLKGYNAARTSHFSMVICEADMPNMSGLDILRFLKESNRIVQVILMTATPTKELVMEAVKQGAAGILIKNFQDPNALETLDSTLERAKAAYQEARKRAVRDFTN